MGAEAQASEVRPQGEDWGWLCGDSLKGAITPQLARRQSGRKSRPAKQARDHSFRVCEERGFLPHVPTEGRAPPKQAPEMGVSRSFSSDPRDRHETLMLLLLPPGILCARTGHYLHPIWEPVQHTTARVLRSRDNIPGRTHVMPQAVAMSHQPLPPQARPSFQL